MANTKTFIQIILVAIAAFAAFFFIYVNIPQQNGIQLIPRTVNEEEDMVKLLELGVDGIITDYPDVALTLKL